MSRDGGQDVSISELTMQKDGKLRLMDFGNTKLLPYRIEGNTLHWTDSYGEDAIELIEQTDKYVKFKNLGGVISTLYFIKADAENSPVQEVNS